MRIGPLWLNPETGALNHDDGREIHITRQQQMILERLAQKPGTLVTKEQLIFSIYAARIKEEPEWGENVVSVQLRKLRIKLAEVGGEVKIVNKFARGWVLSIKGSQQ